ncbi:MAG: tetratricopeptide repeat protein [Anaerolineae bacterium]|nr:tetratricopeptide repeat protein [Anaerolineae bacterium]
MKRIRAASLIRKGIGQQNRGDIAGAILTFTRAILLLPDSEMAYYRRARAFWQQQNFEAALADYAEVIRINPHAAEAYQERATLLKTLGKEHDSLEDYARALEIAPRHTDGVYIELSRILYEKGDYDGALKHSDEAVKANPRNPEAYYWRAACYMRQEQYALCAADLNQAVALAPRYGDAHVMRGAAFFRMEQYRDAIQAWGKAIGIMPNNAHLHFRVGEAYRALQEYPKAVESYQAALFHDPQFYDAAQHLALLYLEMGQIEQSLAQWNEVERIRPNDAAVFLGRGAVYYRTNQLDKAKEACLCALSIAPESAAVHVNLGEIYLILGEIEQAHQAFQKARMLDPEDEASLAGLALACYRLGNIDSAKELWQNLIQVETRYHDADWAGQHLHWHPALVALARQLIRDTR